MTSPENVRLHDAHERLLAQVVASESGQVQAGTSRESAPLPEFAGAFGPYELERSLGHGGQGVVYLANDTRLGRKVALKLLSVTASAGATARARFEREATAASRLHHANICTVYEAGEVDGQRFLAMEFVDGEGLTDWIARVTGSVSSNGSGSHGSGESGGSAPRRARVDEAFGLVERIARAVHTAHEAGVVHRDLKPQNIMLRDDGSPVVLDFGLARDDSDDGATLTVQGDVLGTPAYMPPERVRGAGGTADPREDVYGLGAILYECLTGERPFRGHTREQLYQRILTAGVPDPRSLDAAVPREARYVVETAMEKQPDRRYASALDLADELQRLRQREPIRARPVPVWLRLQRWVQRHPAAAIPTIAAFLALTAGIALALLLLRQVDAEARLTNIRALLSESSVQQSRDPQTALLLVGEAAEQLPNDAPDELRAAVRQQLVYAVSSARLVRHLEHEDQRMVGVGFSGDGRTVATVVRGAEAPALRLWPVEGRGAPIESAPIVSEWPNQTVQLTGCAFDAAGSRVLLTPFYGVPRVLSMHDASQLHVLMPRDKPRNGKPAFIQFWHNAVRATPGTLACFVPGADDLALVGAQDGARLWRLHSGEVAAEEVWHDRRVTWRNGVSQIAVSADGALCATGDHDGAVRLLRVAPFGVVGQSAASEQHEQAVHALAFDPSRPLLLSSGWEQPVAIWSTESAAGEGERHLRRVGTLDVNGLTAAWLQFAPSVPGRPDVLAVRDNDRGVQLYRSADGPRYFEHYASVRGNAEVVTLAFSPDGSKFVIGTNGGDVHVFDFQGRELDALHGSASQVIGSCWSPDGRLLVTAESAGSANLWRAADPHLRVHRLPRALFRMKAAAGRLVVTMRDGSFAIMDLEDESIVTRRAPGRRIGTSLALRSDGERLAVGDGDRNIDLWDLSGDEPGLEPVSESGPVIDNDGLAFAPDGTLIISSREGLRLRPDGAREETPGVDQRGLVVATASGVVVAALDRSLWSCEPPTPDDARVLWPADAQYGPTRADASADGRWLALCSSFNQGIGRVRVVDVIERRLHCEMAERGVRGLALSADGGQLVTSNANGAVRLWDLDSSPPRRIVELQAHEGIAWDAAFHPDGKQLITCGSDGAIRFWPIAFEELADLAKARTVRSWNADERERYRALIGR